MAHVFRLHTQGGSNTLDGWATSNGYGSKAIDSILDPQGATYKREITSIPSPFARIDLVKNAFRQVVNSKDLDNQQTIHHKLVSDCLDVAEIFFNIEKLRDKFEIITWSKIDSLKALSESFNPAHKQLAHTINMYLTQDKRYNFALMQNIYLLNYKGPGAPSQVNIVGATSPATLFFTSANKLNYISNNIQFGNDRPFDTSFQPLYKRDTKFILFWYGLRNLWSQIQDVNSMPFANLFKEVDDYLELTYKHLTEDQKNLIRNYTISEWKKLNSISISSVDDVVEVLGCPMKCLNPDSTFKTDFKIDSDFNVGGKKPLVLPTENFRKPFVYTQDQWDSKTNVPIHDPLPLELRKLPNDGRKYPYLTLGDFLEDTIICNQHPLNANHFFNGGDVKCEDGYSYLIPVKKLYFECFTVDDLKKYLKLERCSVNDSKSVKVKLEIPIVNDNGTKALITYERFYYEELSANDNKSGKVLVKDFALNIFPFIKYKEASEANYRVIVTDLEEDELFNVSVADNGTESQYDALSERNRDGLGNPIYNGRNVFTSRTYLFNRNFTHLYISADGVTNLVIPSLPGKAGGTKFDFAIDFGTSNTHIEYRVDGGQIKPFNIDAQECLMTALNKDYGIAYDNMIKADFFPDVIGEDYKFPTRTVMSEKIGLDWTASHVKAMAETNIPLVYQTMPLPKYNKTTVDLKWSREQESQYRISSYFENIIILLRNKVLLNGGNLADTRIAWFYPASMAQNRVAEIRKAWNEKYERYFGGNATNQVFTMSESLAPYNYYRRESKATTDAVSVDIGGGTSDILLVQDGVPAYLSSCQFAANSIFDCLPCHENPFVKKYWGLFSEILTRQGMGEIVQLVDNIKNEGKPASEVIMLLFSLISNRQIQDKKIVRNVDYSSMLYSDPKLKILFLLFYTALIYHIAKLMKAKDLKEPRHLSFSGTGSKVLNILIDVSDKSVLERYTILIFEKVYGRKYDSDGLDILLNTKNPKEVTCKGGLIDMKSMSVNEIQKMRLAILGTRNVTFVDESIKYADVIKDDVLNEVADEISDFTALFFQLDKEFSFHKSFGTVKSEKLVSLKKYFTRDIKKYVKDGISEKGQQDEVEETLFFYPISGILSAIAGDNSMLDTDE